MSEMLSVDDAVQAIRMAPNAAIAQQLSNDVAMAAMRGHRPESDADACRAAFFATWNESLIEHQRQAPHQRCYWTGD